MRGAIRIQVTMVVVLGASKVMRVPISEGYARFDTHTRDNRRGNT